MRPVDHPVTNASRDMQLLKWEVDRIGQMAEDINLASFYSPLDDFLGRRYAIAVLERTLPDVVADIGRSPQLLKALNELRELVHEGDEALARIQSELRPSANQEQAVRKRVGDQARRIKRASGAAASELKRLLHGSP